MRDRTSSACSVTPRHPASHRAASCTDMKLATISEKYEERASVSSSKCSPAAFRTSILTCRTSRNGLWLPETGETGVTSRHSLTMSEVTTSGLTMLLRHCTQEQAKNSAFTHSEVATEERNSQLRDCKRQEQSESRSPWTATPL